jgi:FkbM family methyltransferase
VLSSRGCPKQWVPASPSECPSVPPPPPDGQIAGWEEGATGAPCACGPCPPRPCECTLQGGCTMFARLRDEAAGKGFTHKKRPTAFSLEHPKLDMDKTGMVVAHMKEFDVKVFTYPASEDQYVSGSLQNQGAWEDDKLHRLCNKYKEHGKGKSGVHFMDVGANIGSITIPMAKCIAGMGAVIAVEAMPHIADHVMAGIEANALPNVALYRYALTSGFGAPGGSLKMSLDSNNKGGTSVVGNKHNGAEIAQLGYTILEVPITTLDEILAQDERLKSVLVMKIDIEGAFHDSTPPQSPQPVQLLLSDR